MGFWGCKGRETQDTGGLSPVFKVPISFTREEVARLCRGWQKLNPDRLLSVDRVRRSGFLRNGVGNDYSRES